MTGITDFNPTDALNTAISGESLEGNVANMGRMEETLQAIIGAIGRWTSSDTIASASTTDIGAQEEAYLTVSGTTTITALGTVRTGTIRFLRFSGILTLTHNATSLILPGAANIVTAAGDAAVFVSEGSGNWRCIAYQKSNGASVSGIVLNAIQATTSGTTSDFTSIPSGVKAIHLHLNGISLNANGDLLVQVGDSGGIENTGYDGSYSYIATSSAAGGSVTSGFCGMPLTASETIYGTVTLRKRDPSSDVWFASSVLYRNGPLTIMFAGAKALTGTLDRVRLTTVAGTATFDAGSASISWEF